MGNGDKGGVPDARVVFLYPGEVYVGRGRVVLKTVLGSCVAVCLWDVELRMGGMNHFMLARRPDPRQAAGRFGDTGTWDLVRRLRRRGARAENLRAKVFGGAAVIAHPHRGKGHLGSENVDMAIAVLGEEGIPVVERNVGGANGRRIVFRLSDGTTWVKNLGGPHR